jgi:hypothetical protein
LSLADEISVGSTSTSAAGSPFFQQALFEDFQSLRIFILDFFTPGLADAPD